ncbi:MAG TPA: AzlD domain-containing protein [Patescibacteria group bacterium]|nr:AzlD domain-containing protein [Patescibacteria group bacterium]
MRTEIVGIILGMAAVTFLTRFGALALFHRTGIPSWFGRWCRHLPTGILTALVVPGLLMPSGQLDISLNNHYLLAGLAAAFMAYRFQNILLTLGVGFGVMFSLRGLWM